MPDLKPDSVGLPLENSGIFRYSNGNSDERNDMSMRTSQKKQVLSFSIFIILLAQINLDIFASNFRVSMGVLLLPILIFLYQKIAVLPIVLLSGFGVYLSRVLIHGLQHAFSYQSLLDFFPELIFYYVYGCLFFLYFRKIDYKLPHRQCYLALFFMDYFANLSELICRLQLNAITPSLQINILLVALARTVILWAVITGLSQYKFLLISAEHAHRYQRLILLISKLNSEIIWMQKNAVLIEDAMAKSYRLFSQLQEQQSDTELTQNALTVAKDIHEVKKEYLMILRGLSEALDLNLRDGDMSLSDILTVLQNSMTILANEKEKKLAFHANVEFNFKTDKHYFLLSVFRNLFTNALEASCDDNVTLTFTQQELEEDYLFEVTDNGPGIPRENLDQIFNPGFSTKINFETGEISRGLGLNLVEDVVKNQLQGSVRVESQPGKTTFYISIPKKQLEVHQV
jgi:two-component system sensor histidine kinase YcbA